MNASTLSLNMFDFILLAVLAVGVYRGRKRGMSEEVLDLVKWGVILVGVTFGYKPLAGLMRQFVSMPLFYLNCMSYLLIVGLGHLLFAIVRRVAGEKLLGSDSFGPLEYYLGMIAGAVRFGCITLVVLSIIHARLITDAQYQAERKEQLDLYGSNFFFTWGSIQRSVFNDSFSGPHIKKNLGFALIEPQPMQEIISLEGGPGRRRERDVDEVMGGSRKR